MRPITALALRGRQAARIDCQQTPSEGGCPTAVDALGFTFRGYAAPFVLKKLQQMIVPMPSPLWRYTLAAVAMWSAFMAVATWSTAQFPRAPLREAGAWASPVLRSEDRPPIAGEGLMWALGVIAIGYGARLVHQRGEERARNQRALRESEARYRALFEQAAVGVAQIETATGRYLHVNQRYCDFVGYTRHELRQMKFSAVTHPDDLPANLENIARLAAGEIRDFTMEKRYLRPDGSEVWGSLTVSPLWPVGGEPQAHTAIVQDITERKRAEAALLRSEEKFRTVAEFTHDWEYWIAPDQQHFPYMSPACERITGYRAEEFLRDPQLLQKITHPHDRHLVTCHLDTVRPDAEHSHELEFRITTRGGAVRWIAHACRPVRSRDGVFLGRRASNRDITGRKRAEEELRSSGAELAAIYDHAPIIMCLLDEDRRVVHLNHAAIGLTNRAPAEFPGLRVGDVLGCVNAHDDSRGCGFGPGCESCILRRVLQQTLDTGRSLHGVAVSVVVNRIPREIHLTTHAARIDIGGQRRVLLCMEDVTEPRRTETALKQIEEQFRQAQKMEAVGELAGGVAHDFNNILAAVLMYVGLLQDEPSLGRALRISLKEVEKEVRRGAALTRQLLAFSRQQVMETTVVDVNSLLAGLMKMLRRLLGEHITMSLQGRENLPHIEADVSMLEQVVINLCVNARDAMPRGGELILRTEAVEICAAAATHAEARAGRFLCLSVIDTGCGIEEKLLERIFEPFFTTKEVGRGTGLGLSTVYGIVKQHQGWVAVESTVGQGTTFRVYLPISEITAEAAREAATPPARGGSETVLIVEDEAAVRIGTGRTLQRHGYRVIEAADGPEALRRWQEHNREIDLLLTDMVMPGGLNGRELASRIRSERPELKVVICTGYSDVLVEERLDPSARIAVLRKPFDSAQLLNGVRKCLDGS